MVLGGFKNEDFCAIKMFIVVVIFMFEIYGGNVQGHAFGTFGDIFGVFWTSVVKKQ